MCLEKTSIFPKIAKKDIVTYKFVRIGKTALWTPYTDFTVSIGDTVTPTKSILRGIFTDSIGPEGIHSFIHPADAEHYAQRIPDRAAIVRCHIPKNSLYYLGKELDIASSKLVYDEIIQEFDNWPSDLSAPNTAKKSSHKRKHKKKRKNKK